MAAVLEHIRRVPSRFIAVATVEPREANQLPLGAVLVECLPGRAAVVMTPQIDALLPVSQRDELASALLLALDGVLQQQKILLAQALTERREHPTTAIFQAAGYRVASDLLYLAADLTGAANRRIPGFPIQPLELVAVSHDEDARWIRLIEQTYEKTLDCPAVDGLRPTRHVLQEYRDIGVPRTDWWFIARYNSEDIGCLILADHRPAAHAELVYMGLTPDMRGRGWGVHLAHQAQLIAATSGAQHLVLSVDAANLPALRHYQTAGFKFLEQRTVLVKAIIPTP
ncbi:GNAT family N-acetyltransferase [Anatilimnocola floriformis]|uniref:GNAT family N-acetyltransferase n=1 Tax=Anatilimnocola floriformis TaxID=2948575 RepID=UPI0020C30F60|nr:GNAT family N-acetyltransferase [Anatilimnocola floriformis]